MPLTSNPLVENDGFDPQYIEEYKAKMTAAGKNYLLDDEDENGNLEASIPSKKRSVSSWPK